ncbi:peptide MFS transporter [Aureispira anguillae]|uniref:Peptide MFS transporter n=1 Tax=Aureispira anguillae TaxID=2864201 RepID=A0A915YLX2_9BACT|nr:peptide MFS transporter [Aureispira anguillae]BDS15439.1 peptide MFS transporter [Aureispira anguillae]
MDTKTRSEFFETQVLGHPAGLMVLFFTEMWERFSFYGMRVLLINFLTMAAISYNPGWEWSAENAGALFGTYAGLLYLTPILGGLIADKYIGYRWAVVVGSIIMTLGHASMALETEFSLYVGLALLVIGTGFFKPNMTSIVSEMYKDLPEKKDGAYTIFYMGVNSGAFFGMMLCGYLAERVGWSWGFGLAGIFMLFGTLQFWLAKPLFGDIGEIPSKVEKTAATTNSEESEDGDKRNPFTLVDKILVVISAIIGFGYLINDPMSKIGNINMFNFEAFGLAGQDFTVIIGLLLFLFLVVSRILRYDPIVRDRMIAFIIFAFFTIFFWMSFEQGASSLVIFARDNVNRSLSGSSALAFNIVNILLTVIPLLIITYVLYLLWKQTFKKIPYSNIVLVACFAIVWGIVVWMINRDFSSSAYEVSYQAIEKVSTNAETGKAETIYIPITEAYQPNPSDKLVSRTTKVAEPVTLSVGQKINIIKKNNEGTDFAYLGEDKVEKLRAHAEELRKENGIIPAEVSVIKENQVEITVSWFSILNSFFIIAFASLFSKWWDSKYNPSAAVKYALGLIIMAVGFGFLAIGSYGVTAGVKVSMIWLIIAYLFHTLGELCLSPVGLSYVSKLVPARMIAFMFGMWYLAIAIGNKLAAVLGGQIENITKEYSLSVFFLIFTIVPAVAGVLILFLNPLLKKLMHGVK